MTAPLVSVRDWPSRHNSRRRKCDRYVTCPGDDCTALPAEADVHARTWKPGERSGWYARKVCLLGLSWTSVWVKTEARTADAQGGEGTHPGKSLKSGSSSSVPETGHIINKCQSPPRESLRVRQCLESVRGWRENTPGDAGCRARTGHSQGTTHHCRTRRRWFNGWWR